MENIIAAQKLVEKTLRLLKTVVDQTTDAVAFVDVDGTLRFANQIWSKIHGYDASVDLTGKPLSKFHTQKQMTNDVAPLIEEARKRGTLAGPIEHIRNNGSPFFTDTRITVVRDEAGREIGLVIFAVDITERKRIENELKAKCDTLARHINDLTQQFNQANQKLQHETIERVEAQDRLTHYRRRLQQFVSQFAAELTLEDDLSRVKADFPDLCEKGLLESIINAEKTN